VAKLVPEPSGLLIKGLKRGYRGVSWRGFKPSNIFQCLAGNELARKQRK